MEATIALAGNPNSGKTTLFNALTGSRQHVGNYPGVTVEKKQGTFIYQGNPMIIVDLPGTYSLTAYSLEEVVARDFVMLEKPEAIVNIVDASNLERNLYLSLQFMEMGIPLCIALNMMDVAANRGMHIDVEKLSELLRVPIIPTVARNGKGKTELIDTAANVARHHASPEPLKISYGKDIDESLIELEAIIQSRDFLTDIYPARWIALKYIENDQQIRTLGQKKNSEISSKLDAIVKRVANHLRSTLETYPEAVIADYRYGYIKSIIKQGVLSFKEDPNRFYLSDKIDRIVTHRFSGPLIMMAVIIGLYHFTFSYSEIPVGWMESFFGWMGNIVSSALPDGMLKSLVVSGIIDGVGGVLGFVPLIMLMFFGIALLEDSGYLARVAFMLDRVFRIFGLHGSSVMPFIISGGIAGGCAVPGIMATRTLKSPRERLATLLTVPFMNCGAKLPVFAVLIAAFFPANQALIMVMLTLTAWLGALIVAKLLRVTVIKGAPTPFVMELPPYRLPTLRGLLIHTWERTWQYIKKAGTVILGISIILWAMMTFPGLPESEIQQFEQERQALISAAHSINADAVAPVSESAVKTLHPMLKEQLTAINAEEARTALRHSAAGRLGIALESVTRWAGFDWRTNIALLGGFAAKEVIVSTLGTAYSLGEVEAEQSESLSATLASEPGWRPLSALSLIIFIMFYAPCFVSVVCICQEAGSWKWGVFSVVFNTTLALGLAVLVYQAGSALGY